MTQRAHHKALGRRKRDAGVKSNARRNGNGIFNHERSLNGNRLALRKMSERANEKRLGLEEMRASCYTKR
jgi:hypothetical protein